VKSGTAINEVIKEQAILNWTTGKCDKYCTQEKVCILLKKLRV
jgi:hypothetical protein